jgi:hypothetical protein
MGLEKKSNRTKTTKVVNTKLIPALNNKDYMPQHQGGEG